jgi:hypothetical protein
VTCRSKCTLLSSLAISAPIATGLAALALGWLVLESIGERKGLFRDLLAELRSAAGRSGVCGVVAGVDWVGSASPTGDLKGRLVRFDALSFPIDFCV